jgi:hypothetical protein
MKTVLLAAVSFATALASPGLVLSLAALYFHSPRRPTVQDDFLVASYLVAISSSLSTLGFLLPTALSAGWRRLAAWRAILIAGALGLLAPLVALAVAALSALAVLPLFRTAPWLATTLLHALPGVLLGATAPLIARAWAVRAAAGHRTGAWGRRR